MKIIFLGTPEYASKHLEALLESNYDIVGVVTQPDRPAGRGQRLLPSPVKEIALRANLPVFEKMKDIPFDSLKPDIGIVVAYGALIKEKYLNLLPLGFYNVHPSLLPKYRGAAPIQRAIENGEKVTGVTLFKLTKELDAGPIAAQISVTIDEYENFDSLETKLIKVGEKLLKDFLKDPTSFSLVPQDESQATYAPKITAQDIVVDFNKSTEEVKNKIRAYDSRPGARTTLRGEFVKVFGVRKTDKTKYNEVPGTIVYIDHEGGHVTTVDGIVVISQIQFPSKKKVSFLEAMNGRLIKIKDRFV
ncbi:methionyl-tRNA formyltransferase [Thermotoga profunda]|uniref:methionyl-tRNA formyltransferase n=1 Tax=Thermotoga profunda TaxID=1508420 RepID=UPI00059751EA|nr:methionyl-tRNA formyltransferase [Thermotoga profunda]